MHWTESLLSGFNNLLEEIRSNPHSRGWGYLPLTSLRLPPTHTKKRKLKLLAEVLSSGIVYAGLGVLFVSSLTNIPYYFVRLKKRVDESEQKLIVITDFKTIYPLIITILTVAAVIFLVISPNFLGKGPEIGKVAHGTGFLGGLAIAYGSSFEIPKNRNIL